MNGRKTTRAGAALALLAVGLGPLTARGQTPAAKDKGKDESLKVTVSERLRFESWDWFDSNAADDSYGFLASQLRLGLSQQKKQWSWQVELQQPTLLGLPENAIAPAPQGQLGLGASYFSANNSERNAAGVFLKQAWVRYQHQGDRATTSVRLGRFEFVEGAETSPQDAILATLKRERIAHRLIGNFAFSHVGRRFDGVQFVRATAATNLTFLAARATEGVFQLDGNAELDVDMFYGALTRSRGRPQTGEWRVFALHYHDGRRALKTDNRAAPARIADTSNIRITTLGAHYVDTLAVAGGKADILLWSAAQFGDWGVQRHRAEAIAAEAGYQPRWDRLKPWIRLGYFRSSGDGDPADDRHNTFFQVLPTPRIYARFPFYNLMNSEDLFAQLWLRPHQRLTLRSDVHGLRLSHRNDLWYLGGGAFQQGSFGYVGRPSGGGRSLATLADVSADYQVSKQFTLSGYLGVALGRSVISSTYANGGNARFSYVELTWRR